jgi:hypothetical protein
MVSRFRPFVYGFYDPIFARMFCEEAPIDAMCAAVTSVLAGDVERPALAVRLLNRITLLLIGLARFFERPAEQRPLAAAG